MSDPLQRELQWSQQPTPFERGADLAAILRDLQEGRESGLAEMYLLMRHPSKVAELPQTLCELFNNYYCQAAWAALTGDGSRSPAASTVALSDEITCELFGTHNDVQSRNSGDQIVITGQVKNIPMAETADNLILQITEEPGGRPIVAVVPGTGKGVERFTAATGPFPSLGYGSYKFDNCTIAAQSVIRKAARSTPAISSIVAVTRLAVVAVGLGLVDCALTEAVDYVLARRFSHARLGNLQSVRHRLASVEARFRVCEAHLFAGAHSLSPGTAASELIKVAIVAGRLISDGIEELCQLFGGRGFLESYWIARAYREAAFFPILLGRPELMASYIRPQLDKL